MDEMVLATQKWLNETYGDDSRYNVIDEDGLTGWGTIYALTRALQIELGITSTADNFGPTTQNLYSQNELSPNSNRNNMNAILQGSLWCKGYDTGHYAQSNGIYVGLNNSFDSSVANAVINLKEDMGFINPDATVTVNVMKSLLSMDSFKLLASYGGDANIRTFQQEMNRKYEDYIGIMPCDGLYGRNTNIALIYALQAEEGLPVSVANGNFGPTTKNCCPTIPYNSVEKNYAGSTYTSQQIESFTKLFKFGLYVNGFGNGTFSGTLDTSVVTAFQQHHALTQTGVADIQTWMSALISCGDTSRSVTACDTRFEITSERLSNLKTHGYLYIGRYLTGGDFKEIRDGELERIFNEGLRVFPIYQTSGTYASYFTEEQGISDALDAEAAARKHGVPRNTTIYFAVDFDAMDVNITNNILPYFRGIKSRLTSYKIGVYGSRNVCIRVADSGYSVNSFVGDMSTGFSGNLGFPLPDDWAFDQIYETSITHNGNTLDIDKDAFSGRDTGFNTIAPYLSTNETYAPAPKVSSFGYQGVVLVNRSSTNIPVYSELVDSEIHVGGHTAGGNILGYIYPNDFYTRAKLSNGLYDTSFGVTIHDAEKGVVQGYIETSKGTTLGDYDWTQYQEAFHLYNSDATSNLVDSSTNTVVINNETYRVFTVRKYLDRRNGDGTLIAERLVPGTKLAVSSSTAGTSWPTHMYFSYYNPNPDSNTWYNVGEKTTATNEMGGFVDLGLQFGASPTNRAII